METPEPLTGTPQLLTIPDVADALRCSRMHVYRLIKTGELATVDIRVKDSKQPRARVQAAELRRYIEGKTSV